MALQTNVSRHVGSGQGLSPIRLSSQVFGRNAFASPAPAANTTVKLLQLALKSRRRNFLHLRINRCAHRHTTREKLFFTEII